MPNEPWLTVITVVKDDAAGFSETLKSLLLQNLAGVEYVVIDSSTNRAAIPAQLTSSGVSFTYKWITAEGIYAAMNTGIDIASGKYLYFANAGDVFFSADVLTLVHEKLETYSSDFIFGDVEIIGIDGQRVITPHWNYEAEKLVTFSRGHFPCHQGTFTRRAILIEQGGFDTSFSIAADYASFLKLTLTSMPLYVDFVIASFLEGGVSTTAWKESFRQFHRARREILKPSGSMAVREQIETLRGFISVFIYREIIGKIRRRRA